MFYLLEFVCILVEFIDDDDDDDDGDDDLFEIAI